MKYTVILFILFLLPGCLSGALDKTDYVLEQRLTQVETIVSTVKSEAIAEAREAAANLVDDAIPKLEASGKEVISHAAKELDAVVEKRLEQVGEITSTERKAATNDIQKILRTDVPKAVEDAIVNSADKIAERLGAVKTTVPGPDGIPIEMWGAAGGGLLGFLGVGVQFLRNYMNSRSGKKRFTEHEISCLVQERIEKNGFNYGPNVHTNSKCPNCNDLHHGAGTVA